MARRRGKSNVITVDFTGVEAGGGAGFKIAEGDYQMQLVAAEQDESGSGNQMFVWDFKGMEGAAKGKKFRMWTSLQPQALWKLKGLLLAMGYEVPDSAMDIDLEEIIADSPQVIGTVVDDTYEGKVRSKLSDVSPVDGEVEDEEEEDAPQPRGKKRAADADDDDEDSPKPRGKSAKAAPKLSADEVGEMSVDELEDLIEKHDLEVDLSEFKTPRKKAAAVIAALEENELLDE